MIYIKSKCYYEFSSIYEILKLEFNVSEKYYFELDDENIKCDDCIIYCLSSENKIGWFRNIIGVLEDSKKQKNKCSIIILSPGYETYHVINYGVLIINGRGRVECVKANIVNSVSLLKNNKKGTTVRKNDFIIDSLIKSYAFDMKKNQTLSGKNIKTLYNERVKLLRYIGFFRFLEFKIYTAGIDEDILCDFFK